MKLRLLDIALCRTPVFSLENTLVEKWEELKLIIKNSSPPFYQLIADVDVADIDELDQKIRYTIWKYFNRAKYRATPFGAFAAISLIPVSMDHHSPIILNDALIIHEFNDWKETENFSLDSVDQVSTSNWFLSNSTIYPVGQNIRYIQSKKGVFEVAEVTGCAQIQIVLTLCRAKTSSQVIHDKLRTEFKLKKSEILALLAQMVSLQLLLTERSVNITGEDYFERMKSTNIKSIAPYTIAERRYIAGGLNNNELKEVGETISFLAKHLPTAESQQQQKFRSAFLKKFEHRAIPLMAAMDLETGIGYGDLGGSETEYLLADRFNLQRQNEKKEFQIPYTRLHQFLLDQLMNAQPIRLDSFTNDELVSQLSLPNTLSALFHFWRGHPVIGNIGGCTASGLLGRFTIASPELEKFGQQITAIEENANPGVLFFDVAYQAEKEVDNVNRRKQLYQFELPILSWSCNPEPLGFDDILVTVRHAEIILWSKKYQKRMIPRIPSAYNYNRSDLAVFRFLCDLQHQEIKSDLNFELPHLFPNLSRYPRVSYKNVIVSPACWLLPEKLLSAVSSGNIINGKFLLREWLQQEGINFIFKTGQSDQTLCFDPGIDEDIHAFLSYCRQYARQVIYISEALISDYEVLSGRSAKRHVAQFVISYSHENKVYEPYEVIVPDENDQTVRMILPGQDWLYFEIYCHQARANSILIDRIGILLKEMKAKFLKWFFIRYEDPLPHIRLRLNLKEVSEGYLVIAQLKSMLDPDVKSGLVSDIQIKTYFREIDRYGSDRIESVEQLFFQDSKYVLTQLALKKSTDDLYVLALIVMQYIIATIFNDLDEQIIFAKQMASGFSKELNMDQSTFKNLNQRFIEFKPNIKPDSDSSFILPKYLQQAYTQVFILSTNIADRRRLLGDLFHMHINRLFNSDQRSHEAILYHYLLKLLTTRRALLTTVKHAILP